MTLGHEPIIFPIKLSRAYIFFIFYFIFGILLFINISISKLKILLFLHLKPINVIIFYDI